MARTKQTAIGNADFLRNIRTAQSSDTSNASNSALSETTVSDTQPHRSRQYWGANVEFLERGRQGRTFNSATSHNKDVSSNDDNDVVRPQYKPHVLDMPTTSYAQPFLNNLGSQQQSSNVSFLEGTQTFSQNMKTPSPQFTPQPVPILQRENKVPRKPQMMISGMNNMMVSNVGFLQGLPGQQAQQSASNVSFLQSMDPSSPQIPSSNVGFLQSVPPQVQEALSNTGFPQRFSAQGQPQQANIDFLQSISPQVQGQQANVDFLQSMPSQMQQAPSNVGFLQNIHHPQSQRPQANIGFLQNIRQPPSSYSSFLGGTRDTQQDFSSRKRVKLAVKSSDGAGESSASGSNTGIQAFKYPPLENNATGNTRLMVIDLVQSRKSGNIHCTLMSTQPWKKGIGYKCLSYVWGDSTITKTIFIKSSTSPESQYCPFYVTINLEAALRRLLETNTSAWIWIDAICINQADLQERAFQVSMMKDIYHNATGVIIWLGESNARLSEAISIINAISAQFSADTARIPHSITSPNGLRLRSEDVDRLKTYLTTDHPHSNKKPAYIYSLISFFFSLSWFRRVWVLQEAFSHDSITVHLGEHVLSWGSIILAALWQACFTRDNTARSANDFKIHEDKRGYLPEMWLGLLHTKPRRGLSMVELVCRARDFEATDARDKVFAMLGLANDLGNMETNPAGLRPDYAKSKVEVYCDFARDLIRHTRSLDILSAVNTFHPRKTKYIPSWMPDLDAPISTIRGLGFPRKYDAAYSTQVPADITRLQSFTQSTLPFSGFVIGSIHQMTSDVLTFRRDLRLYLGTGDLDAVHSLWIEYGLPLCQHAATPDLILAYMHLLAAAGFALPTEFPEHPLGKVVPSRDVPSLLADFAAYWARIDPTFIAFHGVQSLDFEKFAQVGDPDQFGVIAGKGCHERKFFVSKDRKMGLCPWGAEIGDKLVVLYGGSVPYVLRDMGGGAWRFVGEAYVEGWMFGEAKERKGDMDLRDQVFFLQ